MRARRLHGAAAWSAVRTSSVSTPWVWRWCGCRGLATTPRRAAGAITSELHVSPTLLIQPGRQAAAARSAAAGYRGRFTRKRRSARGDEDNVTQDAAPSPPQRGADGVMTSPSTTTAAEEVAGPPMHRSTEAARKLMQVHGTLSKNYVTLQRSLKVCQSFCALAADALLSSGLLYDLCMQSVASDEVTCHAEGDEGKTGTATSQNEAAGNDSRTALALIAVRADVVRSSVQSLASAAPPGTRSLALPVDAVRRYLNAPVVLPRLPIAALHSSCTDTTDMVIDRWAAALQSPLSHASNNNNGSSSEGGCPTYVSQQEVRLLHGVFGLRETPDATTVRSVLHLLLSVEQFKWVKDDLLLLGSPGLSTWPSAAMSFRHTLVRLKMAASQSSPQTDSTEDADVNRPTAAGTAAASPPDKASALIARGCLKDATKAILSKVPRVNYAPLHAWRCGETAEDTANAQIHALDALFHILFRYVLTFWPLLESADRGAFFRLTTLPWLAHDIASDMAMWYTYAELAAMRTGAVTWTAHVSFVKRMRTLCWPTIEDSQSGIVQRLLQAVTFDGKESQANFPPLREVIAVMNSSGRKQRHTYELLYIYVDALRRVRCTAGGTQPALPPAGTHGAAVTEINTSLAIAPAPLRGCETFVLYILDIDRFFTTHRRTLCWTNLTMWPLLSRLALTSQKSATVSVVEATAPDGAGDDRASPSASTSLVLQDGTVIATNSFYALSRNTFVALADPLAQAWRRTPVTRSRTLWDGLLRCVSTLCGEAVMSPSVTSLLLNGNNSGDNSGSRNEGQTGVRSKSRSLTRAALRAWKMLLPFSDTLRRHEAFTELLEEQLLVALDLQHTRIREHATRVVADAEKAAASDAKCGSVTRQLARWSDELLQLGCLAGLLLFASEGGSADDPVAGAAFTSSQQGSPATQPQRFAAQLQHQLAQCVDAMLQTSSRRGSDGRASAAADELLRSWACLSGATRRLMARKLDKKCAAESEDLLTYVQFLNKRVFTPALHARVRAVAQAASDSLSNTEPGASFGSSVFYAWQEQLRGVPAAGKSRAKPAAALYAELCEVSARRLHCTGPARLFTVPELSVLLAVLTEMQLRRGVPGLIRPAPPDSLFAHIAHSIAAITSGSAAQPEAGAHGASHTDVAATLAAIECLIAENVQAHLDKLSLAALLNAVVLDLVSLFDVAALVHARMGGGRGGVVAHGCGKSDGMGTAEGGEGMGLAWLRAWHEAVRTVPLVRHTALFLLYRDRDFLRVDDVPSAGDARAELQGGRSMSTLRRTASLLQWLLRGVVEAELILASQERSTAGVTSSTSNERAAGRTHRSGSPAPSSAGADGFATVMHFTVSHARVYCLAQYILHQYGFAGSHGGGGDDDAAGELTAWYDAVQRAARTTADAARTTTEDEDDGGSARCTRWLRGPAGLQTLYTLFLHALRTVLPCADRGGSDEWFLWLASTTLVAQTHWQPQLTSAVECAASSGAGHDETVPWSAYCTLALSAEQHAVPSCAPPPPADVLTCLPSSDAEGNKGGTDRRDGACGSLCWQRGTALQVCDAAAFPCLQAWATHLFSRLVPYVQGRLYSRLQIQWSRIVLNVLAAVRAYTLVGIDTSRCSVACQNMLHLFLSERGCHQAWRGFALCFVTADSPDLRYQFPSLVRRYYRLHCGLSIADAERLLHAISAHITMSNTQVFISSSSTAVTATSVASAVIRPLTDGHATASRDKRRRAGAETDVTPGAAENGEGSHSTGVSDGEEEIAGGTPSRSTVLSPPVQSFTLRRTWADLTRFLLHNAPQVRHMSAFVAALQCGALLQCTDTAIFEELLAFVLFGGRVAGLSLSEWALILHAVGGGGSRGTDSRRELAAVLRAPVIQCLARCAQHPMQDVTQLTPRPPAMHGAAFCNLLEALPAVFVEDDGFWRAVGEAVRAWSGAAQAHMTVSEAHTWRLQWRASYEWALRSAGHAALVPTT